MLTRLPHCHAAVLLGWFVRRVAWQSSGSSTCAELRQGVSLVPGRDGRIIGVVQLCETEPLVRMLGHVVCP